MCSISTQKPTQCVSNFVRTNDISETSQINPYFLRISNSSPRPICGTATGQRRPGRPRHKRLRSAEVTAACGRARFGRRWDQTDCVLRSFILSAMTSSNGGPHGLPATLGSQGFGPEHDDGGLLPRRGWSAGWQLDVADLPCLALDASWDTWLPVRTEPDFSLGA
jgi:hypothetical protein